MFFVEKLFTRVQFLEIFVTASCNYTNLLVQVQLEVQYNTQYFDWLFFIEYISNGAKEDKISFSKICVKTMISVLPWFSLSFRALKRISLFRRISSYLGSSSPLSITKKIVSHQRIKGRNSLTYQVVWTVVSGIEKTTAPKVLPWWAPHLCFMLREKASAISIFRFQFRKYVSEKFDTTLLSLIDLITVFKNVLVEPCQMHCSG